MEALDADPKISALVLTGSEKAFAAGADIKEMAPKSYMVRLSSACGHQYDNFAFAHDQCPPLPLK